MPVEYGLSRGFVSGFRMFWRLPLAVLILLLSAALGAPARAAERLALVIGNGDYTSKAMPRLANPTNDAALIADTLKRAGFDVTLVMNADLRTMKRAVSGFAKRLSASQDALAFFYFSGHGFQANNLNYLAPLKADLRDEVDAEFEAMSVDWVLAKMEAAHDGANIIVLDACRNTALTRGTGRGLAMMSRTPPGSFISYATAPGSVAADGAGLNSPYSAAIAQELTRPGLAIEQAFKNVRRKVVRQTRGAQVPWDYSSLTGDIVLAPGGATPVPVPEGGAAPETLVELQFWNDAKDRGTAAAIQAYLDRYPDGAFAPLARERLATAGGGDAAAIQAVFARLTTRGLITDSPTEPHEFYANARMYELQGDYPKAREAYLKLFAFDLDKIDPHFRFQNFLVIQEGRAGARRVYNGLTRGLQDPVARFALLLLLDREQRVGGLVAFLAEYPEFAPGWYALSRDYSEAVLGGPALADKIEEERLLNRFLDLSDQGHFLRHFYDQQLAAEQLRDARERLAALSVIEPRAKADPVRLGATRANQGWQVHVYIADGAREIFVEHEGRPLSSTGFVTGGVDPKTGQPMPWPVFMLPVDAKEMPVRVSYLDIRGRRHGPFSVTFDPVIALVEGLKANLIRYPQNWILHRQWEGQHQVNFSNIFTYRCALERIEIGVGRETPDRVLPFPDCDPADPHFVPYGTNIPKPFIIVPKGTSYVTIRLTFRDGTRSDIVRFPTP